MKGLVLAALVASVVLLPTVAADHAFSHRYTVYGRVVDANGDPVPGLHVNADRVAPFVPDGPCANQPGSETEAWGPMRTRPITNEFGEFIFCFHTHALDRREPGAIDIQVGENAPVRVALDPLMRRSVVPIQLREVHPDANATARADYYTVYGRGFQESKGVVKVESVNVYGDTLHNVDVEVVFGDATMTTRTNNYGDYAVRFPIDGAVPDEIVVRINGTEYRALTDPLHWTTVDALIRYVPPTPPAPTTPSPAPVSPTLPPTPHMLTTPNPPETEAEIPWPTGLAVLALVAAARYRASRPK